MGQLNGKRGAGLGFPINNYSTPARLGPVAVASRRVRPMARPVCHKRGDCSLRSGRRCHASLAPTWSARTETDHAAVGKLPPSEVGCSDRPRARGIPRLSVVWRTSTGPFAAETGPGLSPTPPPGSRSINQSAGGTPTRWMSYPRYGSIPRRSRAAGTVNPIILTALIIFGTASR